MSNELQALPDMTLEEAQTEHAELKALEGVMRSKLLRMRDRKGWKALGYSSFSEYGEKEWGYTQSYISRLTAAARIQTVIMPIGINEIPESQTRELGKLPNDDAMREVFEKVAADNEVITAKAIKDEADKWRAENESLQSDLLTTKTALQNKSLSLEAFKQQNNELRDELTANVDAKVNERVASERAAKIEAGKNESSKNSYRPNYD